MSLPRKYDVIVVGAGPAGATLAYELARVGIMVLVIEKSVLPRYKCCGGGITFKVTILLDPEINEAIEYPISNALVTIAGDSYYHASHEKTIMYTVRRDKFDYVLVKRAEEAGADIRQGLKVCELRLNGNEVEVSTNRGSFHSQFVAGADGVNSIVAKALGIKTNNKRIIGIATEVKVATEDLEKWKSQIAIELGRVPAGYAWLFPKADHLSIGIGCLDCTVKYLKRHYMEFLDSLNLNHYTITRWASSLIPVCNGHATVNQGRVVLLGDAAGLADPLTGEGIYNAILSAKLAGSVIKKSLTRGEAALTEYTRLVEEKIMPEMKIAYILSKFLALTPHRLFNVLQRDERVWKGCCYLLRGEIDYSTIKNKLTSLGGLYNFVFRR